MLAVKAAWESLLDFITRQVETEALGMPNARASATSFQVAAPNRPSTRYNLLCQQVHRSEHKNVTLYHTHPKTLLFHKT